MTCLTQLLIQHFRNLNVSIDPCNGINVFYGKNGAGKTSILEAVYFLGLGRSFRSNLIQRLIQNQADQFQIIAQIQQDHQTIPIGVERTKSGEKKIRIDGQAASSIALLAKQLPLQLLTTESHRYFHDGPSARRQFLDWGLFHVEPDFYSLWQQFQRVLKQRNAGLKNQLSIKEIEVWTQELIKWSLQYNQIRQGYVSQIEPVLNSLLKIVLPEFSLTLRYYRGWPEGKELALVLNQNQLRDQQLGYTQFGPQRADLQLYSGSTPVSDSLSQGQQKLAAYVLHLSQGILLQKITGKNALYLIDDLPSELDKDKRAFIAQILAQLKSQVFITCIDPTEVSDITSSIFPNSMFHVEHGGLILNS
ncbi:MAG: DNA replication/repair protein RecF [Proteobacteria bacterium]|nr:DNA replication/repair protein RecF [Pseudomonadota bacterium]